MRIDELIDELARVPEKERGPVQEALVACGAAAVEPVMVAMQERPHPVHWPAFMEVLRSIGRPAFEPIRQALAAATAVEETRRYQAAFQGLTGLAPEDYSAALRDPSPAVREAAVEVFAGAGRLRELTEVFADPSQKVRRRVMRAFGAAGEDAVPLLQEIRSGSGRLRAGALTALAEIGGWEALSESDQAAVTRLIRIKAPGEEPSPMHLCGSWYAVRTADQAAVLEAFDLHDPVRATMAMGASAWTRDAHDWGGDPAHRRCRRMYVTPELNGWTLVFGTPHLDVSPRDPEWEATFRAAATTRCEALSKRFGSAQWFGASCGDDWTAWCIAEAGTVVRFYDVFEPDNQIGDGHPAEEGLLLPHLDGWPDGAFDDIDLSDFEAFRARSEQLRRDLDIPETAHSTDIAGRTSVDPWSLGPQTAVRGRAVLATPGCYRGGPSPRGALDI